MKCMQAGKFPKINKRAGWNKAVQVGIFQKINKMCSTFIRETRVVYTGVRMYYTLVASFSFSEPHSAYCAT